MTITSDRRERPWKKLRVVVEITVPPTSRVSEKDLMHYLRDVLPDAVEIAKSPRLNHDRKFAIRFKTLGSFWPAFLRIEKGLTTNFKKKESK